MRDRTDTLTTLAQRAIPKGGFWRGVLFGLVIAIPAAAASAYAASWLGLGGDPNKPYSQALAFATVFAGLPAIITAGGIGRVVARAGRTRRAKIATAFFPFAATLAGLTFLTLVPFGALPATPGQWAAVTGVGGGIGALCALLFGLWLALGEPRDRDDSSQNLGSAAPPITSQHASEIKS